MTPPGFLYGLSADRLGGALKKILLVVVVFLRSRLVWLVQPRIEKKLTEQIFWRYVPSMDILWDIIGKLTQRVCLEVRIQTWECRKQSQQHKSRPPVESSLALEVTWLALQQWAPVPETSFSKQKHIRYSIRCSSIHTLSAGTPTASWTPTLELE